MSTKIVSKSGWHHLLSCFGIVALFLTGCASGPPPLPSESLRSQLKKIRISNCRVQPEVEFIEPIGAVEGGAKGFGFGFLAGFEGFMLGPVGIVTVPAYAIYGMFKGVEAYQPKAKVEKFEKTYRTNINKINVNDILRLSVAERIHSLKVSEITEPSDQTAPIIMETVVTKITIGDTLWNTPPRLSIIQRTRLIKAADGLELYNHSFGKSGEEYKFDYWLKMDAVEMRKEIEHISSKLAEQIVDEIFISVRPEKKEDKANKPAKVTP